MKALLTIIALALGATTSAIAGDFPEGSPAFEHKLADALSKAKKEDKPVIAIFSAVWCGPCQTMKKNVYPSSQVKPYHSKFVWAYIDADEKGNAADMSKFNVTGIPHLEILDKDGKSIGKQIGSSSPADFVKTLEGALKKAGGAH
jgi:thioredoxin-related protein